jgi:transcriptional regulator with GAF, ATPase, and Fis domain
VAGGALGLVRSTSLSLRAQGWLRLVGRQPPVDRDPRSEALLALSRFLVAEMTLGDTLLKVTEITTEAMPAAEMAGIALLGPDERAHTSIYTDPESPEIDQSQYDTGRGPCLDAWRTVQVVRIDDMESEADRYPAFARAALSHGVESTLSLPLEAGGQGLGALNLYARRPRGFSAHDEAIGVELAAAAAAVLANATAYWGAVAMGEQLDEAMRSRAVIEQAKGMLMAQSPGMGPDEAFELLRRASQRENVKVRDIAARIVARQPWSTAPGS